MQEDAQTIGVGMLGYAFMGKAHSSAYKTIAYGFARHVSDWREPPGHIIGWGDTFVHELHNLLEATRDDGDVASHGATLEDGYRAAEVCDAIVRSAAGGRRELVTYR